MYSKKLLLLALLSVLSVVLVVSACGDKSSGTDGDVSDGDIDNVITDGDDVDNTTDGDTDSPIIDGDKDNSEGSVIIDPDGDDDGSDRITGCLDDSDCSGSDYCDKDSGLCKRKKSICEPCTTSQECGYRDDACIPSDLAGESGICGYFCEDQSDCDEGFNCETIPNIATMQCVFNGSVNAGSTGDSCCADLHCQAPLVCHPQTSKCYEGCTGSGTSACPPNQVCVDDSTDDRNGHCAPGCDESSPCPGGQVCVDNTCIEGDCAIKEHCPIEYLCNTTDHRCVPGCEIDTDCFGSNECIDGQCVERVGCEGTWQCSMANMCTVEIPDAAPADRGCCYNPKTSGTEECPNPNEPVKLCDVCTDTQNQSDPPECGQSALGKNYCVTLQDKDENPIGDFCLIRWDCSVWDEGVQDEGTQECPRGYSCIKMNQGNEMDGKYCMADCTDPLFQ